MVLGTDNVSTVHPPIPISVMVTMPHIYMSVTVLKY